MSTPDPTKIDGKNLACIGDKLWVTGYAYSKHTTASPIYTQNDGYHTPSVMWRTDSTYRREFRILFEQKLKEPMQVVYIGWTHLFIGEFHHNYDGEGYLSSRESVFVLTVMPYTPTHRYRKPFHVLPSQVQSKVTLDK